MSIYAKLANAMFPNITMTPADYEEQYPQRQLAEGARVTRIAPSPTGYLHLGTFFTSMVNRMTADSTGGLFFFRLEDTDKKREVEGGADDILKGMNDFGLTIDEGFVAPGVITGDYGPYQQSKRAEIYHAYVKQLVEQNLAYPCFCSEEARQAAREQQEAAKDRTGYYGKYAVCRSLTAEEALAKIEAGESYVVRLRSMGSESNRIKFDDMIKGTIEMPENDEDIVLLKSDGIPTYHFAHAVDDHLMRTTHVIRGDEWISSVPKHLQLFKTLGFKPPKYAHVSPIMVEDNGNKRKLSKRKDPQAAMHFYAQQGYPADSVLEYLLTIANSDYEDWRRANPTAARNTFKFNLKKMSVSGALFDLDKLNDISKNELAKLSETEMYDFLYDWANEFGTETQKSYFADKEYMLKVLTLCMGIGGKKRRKDFTTAKQAVEFISYFFDATFAPVYEYRFDNAVVKTVLEGFKAEYDYADDCSAWFDKVKSVAAANGFATDMKAYKADPTAYPGNVSDVAEMLRIATTGLANTPDLWTIMQILGSDRTIARLNAAIAAL